MAIVNISANAGTYDRRRKGNYCHSMSPYRCCLRWPYSVAHPNSRPPQHTRPRGNTRFAPWTAVFTYQTHVDDACTLRQVRYCHGCLVSFQFPPLRKAYIPPLRRKRAPALDHHSRPPPVKLSREARVMSIVIDCGTT